MTQLMSPAEYANLPASTPPVGVLPNFEHPPTRAIETYVVMGICMGITLVFVLLRLYVKMMITRLWGWDDGQ